MIEKNTGYIKRPAFVLLVISVICTLFVFAPAQKKPNSGTSTPAAIDYDKLNTIEQVIQADIAEKKLPGAVVLIGHKGKIVFRKAFGKRSLVPASEAMTVDTIFDLASLTKPIATATSIMVLLERGKIRLTDTVGKFIPEIEDSNAKNVTILQLLTHTSGYAPDFDLSKKWLGRNGMLEALRKEKLANPSGTRFVYSDIGFIVLGEIVQRVSGESLDVFAGRIFAKLGMAQTRFAPFDSSASDPKTAFSSETIKLVAPTENIKGQMSYLGGSFTGTDGEKILTGFVHDPTAYRMGGVAGHAGLFSTADDLAKYCMMLLNGGLYNGQRVLSPQTVALMTAPVVVSEIGATRGLGWDINTGFSSNRGELFPLGSFGHTGFTGTSVWIDPASQTFVIFLSNRVHPDGKGDVTPLRARVATIAASALADVSRPDWVNSAADYYSAVSAQIPRFAAQAARTQQRPTNESVPSAEVLNGIDVLIKNGFEPIKGKKIGLVTNQTGRDLSGRLTIDILASAPEVKLVALFSPEHGIRGELDQSKIDDSRDEKTGLPIFSLYGETRRPKQEQLNGLDAIVYDIQDVGARFYTYTTTLKYVLEEAAKAKIPVFVLDRPNPINGIDLEGPLADKDKLSFIAAHEIPVRYGMTIGELALMMNEEDRIGADLKVIKMEGWRRQMWFDQTGQTWVNPSPNMRSLTQATLYPGIGLLETTNLSVGRGTDTPFELIGAPWIDARRFAQYLNAKRLPGVRFVPVKFTPRSSVYKGQECSGVNILVTDRNSLRPVLTGFAIAETLKTLYPKDWELQNFNRLLVSSKIFEMFSRGESMDEILREFSESAEGFRKRRARFLLY
ncbi:MAG TPA: exo-beta-N-acetylmuramidase NamZ domain-containing protein [Pyrinomonadaceae bacterium]|nr:exo-beta-N-acetylmuramidase NamZ domain-containing protein [Pyrinomonadaceae bacterium]